MVRRSRAGVAERVRLARALVSPPPARAGSPHDPSQRVFARDDPLRALTAAAQLGVLSGGSPPSGHRSLGTSEERDGSDVLSDGGGAARQPRKSAAGPGPLCWPATGPSLGPLRQPEAAPHGVDWGAGVGSCLAPELGFVPRGKRARRGLAHEAAAPTDAVAPNAALVCPSKRCLSLGQCGGGACRGTRR